MVKLNKIVDFLDSFAPFDFAESYDNVGLLVGDKDKEINRVLITLDADKEVINDAKSKNCDLVISHHPLIFKALKRVVSDDAVSKTLMTLIKNDISLVSVHTNFDSVKFGLCDLFLDKIIKTKNREALSGDSENGIGRIADLCEAATLEDILNSVRGEFDISNLRYVGDKNRVIKRIAVCNGGGAEFVYDAKEMGADLYVSGDIKYQHARYAYENDITLIEIPHYNAEIIFCQYLKEILEKEFENSIEILVTDKNKDVWSVFGDL